MKTVLMYALYTSAIMAVLGAGLVWGMVMMAMGPKQNAILFSKVEGRLVFNGEPVKGAKIIRKSQLYKEITEDITTTNEYGVFQFPLKVRPNTRISGLNHFSISQTLTVLHEGKTYDIWHHSKMDGAENSEYGGEFKPLLCELTQAVEHKKIGGGTYITNCVW